MRYAIKINAKDGFALTMADTLNQAKITAETHPRRTSLILEIATCEEISPNKFSKPIVVSTKIGNEWFNN
jgi:hypothetical protein